MKSKLADEEHKNATMTLVLEERAKEMSSKNAVLGILQDENQELKASVAGAAYQMRILQDEIQVCYLWLAISSMNA